MKATEQRFCLWCSAPVDDPGEEGGRPALYCKENHRKSGFKAKKWMEPLVLVVVAVLNGWAIPTAIGGVHVPGAHLFAHLLREHSLKARRAARQEAAGHYAPVARALASLVETGRLPEGEVTPEVRAALDAFQQARIDARLAAVRARMPGVAAVVTP